MTPGTVEWLEALIRGSGGRASVTAIREALLAERPEADYDEVAARIAHSPLFVALPDDAIGLTRPFLQGAYFRYTPTAREIEQGLLRVEGTELALVYAQHTAAGPDPEVSWRGVSDEAPQRQRLARAEEGWVLPGLGRWYAETAFEAGDDVVTHIREIDIPLLVLDRVSRYDRDEGPLSRRNQALLEAALAALRDTGGGWIAIERLLKQIVARYDYRHAYAPDSFGQRLLTQDTRFTLARDGREVRLSYFYHDDTARQYLQTLASPEEALGAFFEEFPPNSPADREKALAYLNELWLDVPRGELGGLTPRQAAEQKAKIVPFARPGGSA